MRVEDLMIGNWIFVGKIPHTVCQIMNEGIITNKNSIVHYSCIYPIPLTEELLIKCGFTKHKETYYHEKCLYSSNILRILADNYQTVGMDVKVEFLHEMQNIMFILTKEEINIKL